MTLSITPEERQFLLDLFAARQTALLHELHHTDTYDYKEILKRQLEVLESLQQKVNNSPSD